MMSEAAESPAVAGGEAGAGFRGQESQSQSAPDLDQSAAQGIARVGMVSSLDEIAPVASYLRRIGAEPINLERAAVRDTYNRYPREIGGVRFAADGAVKVTGSAEPPSEAEAAAIREAFGKIRFPKPVALNAIADGPPGVRLNDKNTFICHDFEGRVVMVHARYENQDGTKGFIPWTPWSDGRWRKMEPEVMPFYGLPGAKDHATVFIHEGAKAARRIREIIDGEDDAARFPWFEEMRWGHHIGWIGGVNAVDRSDWAALAGLGWSRVIIVADNDNHGLRAARSIAKRFRSDVFIVSFDQRFPEGWDCGDPWPPDLFDSEGCYTGPCLSECLRAATQATEELPPQGRGRPAVIIRAQFAALCAYTVTPQRFVFRHRPSQDYSAEEFSAVVRPFSHVKDTASKLLKEIDCQHDRLVYHPGFGPGTVHIEGDRCFNVFESSRIRPAKGDVALWEEYLTHLVPDEIERGEVKKWLATLIARPDVRMRYGLLLISVTQGVGKNTLANVLKLLLGSANVSFPSEYSIVQSQFNSWIARKRLIFISEIYSGHSRKAYDQLKSVLADDDIEVNEKGIKQYRLTNWATVIACSNSEAALHLDDEDRRWYVPTVAECQRQPEWWQRFYSWVQGDGAGFILQWARDYVGRQGYVRTGDHAPTSRRKQVIVEASRSEGQQLAISFAEHLKTFDTPIILRLSDVRRWIALQRGFRREGDADLSDRRLERPTTIIAVMKKVPGITVWADALRPKFGATREAVVMNFAPEPGATWTEIKDRLTDLKGVKLDEPY
jgi:hypothetical protein